MTIVGTRPRAPSGRYSQPRSATPSSVLNSMSLRIVALAIALVFESIHDGTCAVDADGRHQDRQVQTGGRECRQSLAAARRRADQTNRVEERIAQGLAAHTLPGLCGLRREAADLQQMLEEGQRRVEAEV